MRSENVSSCFGLSYLVNCDMRTELYIVEKKKLVINAVTNKAFDDNGNVSLEHGIFIDWPEKYDIGIKMLNLD